MILYSKTCIFWNFSIEYWRVNSNVFDVCAAWRQQWSGARHTVRDGDSEQMNRRWRAVVLSQPGLDVDSPTTAAREKGIVRPTTHRYFSATLRTVTEPEHTHHPPAAVAPIRTGLLPALTVSTFTQLSQLAAATVSHRLLITQSLAAFFSVGAAVSRSPRPSLAIPGSRRRGDPRKHPVPSRKLRSDSFRGRWQASTCLNLSLRALGCCLTNRLPFRNSNVFYRTFWIFCQALTSVQTITALFTDFFKYRFIERIFLCTIKFSISVLKR